MMQTFADFRVICGARTRACRVETRLDATAVLARSASVKKE
jgi:hypothetical protein